MTLDDVLARWADQHHLSPQEAAAVRAVVLEPETIGLDADWLWSLLRPVTDLLEGPRALHDRLALPYPRFFVIPRNKGSHCAESATVRDSMRSFVVPPPDDRRLVTGGSVWCSIPPR
jgi:hypothetical protein